MYWTQKIKKAFGLLPPPKLPDAFSGEDGVARTRQMLLQNPAIAGNDAIAARLIERGTHVFFQNGDKIIGQGEHDDDVYFLLCGKVDVVIRRRKASIREAPMQVGEMAAIDGKERSATIVARSGEVAALRVSGVVFRDIRSSNPRFQELLQVDLTARHRERIVATQIANENNSVLWFFISLGLATLTGGAIWLFAIPASWTSAAQTVAAVCSGVSVFLLTLFHNPAFVWRRYFGYALFAMIAKLSLDHFVSIEAKQGFGALQVVIGSGNGGTDWTVPASFIVVLAICALMDHLKTGR